MAGVAVLKNLSIGRKLVVMLSAPLVAVLLFAGANLLDKRDVAARTSALEELAQLGVAMSNFVHESQKERGMTGVFVGSGGKKLGSELADQREPRRRAARHAPRGPEGLRRCRIRLRVRAAAADRPRLRREASGHIATRWTGSRSRARRPSCSTRT